MNAKKNLTVVALAALLAVPAFNGTNVGHALHMSSVTAHAAYIPSNYGGNVVPTNSDLNKMNAHSAGYGPGAGVHTAGIPWNSDKVGDQFVTGSYNGHTFEMSPNGGYISKLDGISNPSLAEVNAALGDNTESNVNSNVNTNTDYGNNSETTPNADSSTQYTSQSGKLPQTNENNGSSKAAALGTAAATASVGLAALSFAKKHRDMEAADLADVISAADGKKRNKPSYSAKSSYDMIMSNTFANLSKNLKNL